MPPSPGSLAIFSHVQLAKQLPVNTSCLVAHTWVPSVHPVDKPQLFHGMNGQHGDGNDPTNVTCFVAGVCVRWRSLASGTEPHFSPWAGCLHLRCWNKSASVSCNNLWTNWTVVCSRSDSGEPNVFHTAGETGPLLGTNSVSLWEVESEGRASPRGSGSGGRYVFFPGIKLVIF